MSEPELKKRKIAEEATCPVPSAPAPFLVSSRSASFENGMAVVMESLSRESELKDKLRGPSGKVRNEAEDAIRKLLSGEKVEMQALRASMAEFLSSFKDCPEFLRNMGSSSNAIAAYVGTECLAWFLEHGNLLKKCEIPAELTTNEYLIGVIRFADEVEAYALGRAMWKDIRSVGLCRNLMNVLNKRFMEFNFPNGQLRRRYDSLKYRVRKLENMIYELSLILGPDQIPATGEQDEMLVSSEEFESMMKEISDWSDARDKVINGTRKPQKDSKNAIFDLHRGSMKSASTLLNGALDSFKQIAATTTMTPGELHSGAFSAGLEEYAEAVLFKHWLETGSILPFQSLRDDAGLNETEYLGGLVDFTGELGRYGVAQATKRDIDKVKQVLSSILAVKEYAILLQEVISGKMVKKLEGVMTNSKKMENTLYELILVTNSNRRDMQLSSTEEETMAE